ncbi:hypothetical protein LFAB_05890 [Lactiplantibacillus fabifermentans T30PCM01]|uniref:Uncharacterized protein n=1 Tax=Lactiplantibacillus fabifermentans T30PCM01 TaxID=1400520 RepID=W6T9V2_9LACO|nr:hypothetical protein LFAB_05890 [Lactiplantibacillus fabifermentans T30PCM01]
MSVVIPAAVATGPSQKAVSDLTLKLSKTRQSSKMSVA